MSDPCSTEEYVSLPGDFPITDFEEFKATADKLLHEHEERSVARNQKIRAERGRKPLIWVTQYPLGINSEELKDLFPNKEEIVNITFKGENKKYALMEFISPEAAKKGRETWGKSYN